MDDNLIKTKKRYQNSERNVKEKVIKPSKSIGRARLSLKFCIDYRRLNAKTNRDGISMPELGGKHILSKIDYLLAIGKSRSIQMIHTNGFEQMKGYLNSHDAFDVDAQQFFQTQ